MVVSGRVLDLLEGGIVVRGSGGDGRFTLFGSWYGSALTSFIVSSLRIPKSFSALLAYSKSIKLYYYIITITFVQVHLHHPPIR